MTTRHGSADYGDKIAVGMFRCVANGQPVMQDETSGWLNSIHKTSNGEVAGLAMVAPHVADMVEARVFALDADTAVRLSRAARRRTPRTQRRLGRRRDCARPVSIIPIPSAR
jgi:pyruvate/2-oxoglutarate dehydrogenase complex dihydrolipoamide dehydrogenase (E3) component